MLQLLHPLLQQLLQLKLLTQALVSRLVLISVALSSIITTFIVEIIPLLISYMIVKWTNSLPRLLTAVIMLMICKYSTIIFAPSLTKDRTPGGGGYGQNIAAFGTTNNAAGISASHIVAQAITDLWYNSELEYFLPSFYGLANGGGDFDTWGHFSQIVWTSTSGVGCSAQLCSSSSSPFSPQMPWWFTVCNYSPPGKQTL